MFNPFRYLGSLWRWLPNWKCSILALVGVGLELSLSALITSVSGTHPHGFWIPSFIPGHFPLLFCEWGASCRDAPAAVFVPKPLSWPDFRLSSCLILSPYTLRLSFCPSGVGFVCLLVCFAAVTNGHTLKGLTPSEVEHRAVWEVRRGTWVLLD